MTARNYLSALVVAALGFGSCNNQAGSGNNAGNTESGNAAGSPASWRHGVAMYSFHQIPYETTVTKLDSGSIHFVEGFSFYKLGGSYNELTMGDLSKDQVVAMTDDLKKRDIRMVSMYVAGGNNVEEWKKTFDLAQGFGLEFVTCEPPKEQWDMIDSLASIYKIRVALHNHWKEISIYWHPDSVLAAIRNHPNFGACADLGHWVRSGLDPVESLKKLEGHILGMHLKDVDAIGNKDAKDVNVGTGVINYPAVIAELERQNFKGISYIECEHNFDNNLPDIIQSNKYLDSLISK